MSPRRRRVAAVAVGLAAAAAAVTANLVLLGEARSEDPMGRLSPALEDVVRPGAPTTDVVEPAPPRTVTEPVTRPVVTDDGDGDDHHEDD